jgi:hypothetical protein
MEDGNWAYFVSDKCIFYFGGVIGGSWNMGILPWVKWEIIKQKGQI